MIRSFRDRRTAALFAGQRVRGIDPRIQERARLRLLQIDAARALEDLRNPPSNRLQRKKGRMRHLYCLRVNDQWRICFAWRDGDAHEVQLVDYH